MHLQNANRFEAEDRRPFNPAYRIFAVGLAIVMAFALLFAKLYRLQLDEGDEYAAAAEETKTQTISLSGARGNILDSNGVVLATNRECYQVKFTWDPDKRTTSGNKKYTESLRRVIEMIEEDGGQVIDTFRIVRGEDGNWCFTWDSYLDEEAAAARTKTWASNMALSIKTYPTAEDMLNALKERYGIGDDVSDEEAHKILSVWQEAQQNSYSSYLAQTICEDVPISTVSRIELASAELDGISIEQATVRVYPQQDVAAHIIGYVGSISEDNINDYTDKGYDRNDPIGVSGVEQSMEEYLTGSSGEKRGSRTVEVNNMSKVIRELAYDAPEEGSNVVLTIDTELQKVAYDALGTAITQINGIQRARVNAYSGRYASLVAARGGQEISYAETGAAIVMEAKTGRVLAIADYPSFDLNLFVGGISDEDYAALTEDPRNPLFSRAISSRATPGSIFKPMTATAALMEGAIDTSTTIVDVGRYTLHGIPASQAIHCWNRGGHGSQNVVQAIQNSCNYFFYETAYRLGNENLYKWTELFGLTSKTGIEVAGEATSQVASQKTYYDPDKSLYEQATSIPVYIASRIRSYIREVGDELSVTFTDEELNAAIEKIFAAYVAGDDAYEAAKNALVDEVGIPAAVVSNKYMTTNIVSLLGQLKFGMVDTMITGIGQSVTAVTPIAVARYLSALVNGGNVYEAHVVDRVIDDEGNTVYEKEPTLVAQTGVTQEVTDAVKHGMQQAIQYGSVSSRFRGYKYRTQIGGKTGTAQVSDIDVEDNSWFVCFAPYDDPEIVVVIYIPNGYSSGYCVEPAKQIVQYYLDRQQTRGASGLAAEGSLTQ